MAISSNKLLVATSNNYYIHFQIFVDNKYLPLIIEQCQSCSSRFDGDQDVVYTEEGFSITVVTMEGEYLYKYMIYKFLDHTWFNQLCNSVFENKKDSSPEDIQVPGRSHCG